MFYSLAAARPGGGGAHATGRGLRFARPRAGGARRHPGSGLGPLPGGWRVSSMWTKKNENDQNKTKTRLGSVAHNNSKHIKFKKYTIV